MMMNVVGLSLEERRELELNRVSGRDLALDKELDDLLLELAEDGDSAKAAREVLEAAASSAQVVSSAAPMAALPQHEPTKELVECYGFPDVSLDQVEFLLLSCSDQKRELKALIGTTIPYHKIREKYCAISLAMNERSEAPPKFRPLRPLPRRTQKATSDDTLMMRDRQVIDMHWLHCRGKRDELPDRAFATLFVKDELDFDMAGILAAKSWTNEIKAGKILNLIPHEELQLACLRTKTVADKWRNAENSMKTTVDRRLREQLISEPSLKPHVEDLKWLWLADKVVGDNGLTAVAQMHAWLTGKETLSINTLSTKLKRMRRRTAARGGKA